MTVKGEIQDSCGARLVHMMNIYMKGKTEEMYVHAFEKFLLVVKKFHDYPIDTLITLTDCEQTISTALSKVCSLHNITVLNTFCNVHISRICTRNMRATLGKRTVRDCCTVRLTCLFIQMTVGVLFLAVILRLFSNIADWTSCAIFISAFGNS